MRKLILKMELSLDGYVGRPASGDPGWLLPYYDEELTAYAVELLASAGVHAMGRQAYEDMAPHWQASSEPFAKPMNEIPKAVFSRTLERADWPETTIHRGALADEIAALKAQDGGPILVHGGSRFAQALTRENLVRRVSPARAPGVARRRRPALRWRTAAEAGRGAPVPERHGRADLHAPAERPAAVAPRATRASRARRGAGPRSPTPPSVASRKFARA